MNEVERVKRAYKKRKVEGKAQLYNLFSKAALFSFQQREKAILQILTQSGLDNLSNEKIFDLGCGKGGVLRDFIKYGANPENCFGIDLLTDRIEEAKRISPNMDLRCGNAEKLPFENESFDIILCFTVFSSILEENMRKNIASEMLRVLKPDGIILWYDYFMNNPKNPDVRGVRKKEIHELFPKCEVFLRRITLAPPITRLIAPRSYLLCYLLEKIPFLKTHYLIIIKKMDKESL